MPISHFSAGSNRPWRSHSKGLAPSPPLGPELSLLNKASERNCNRIVQAIRDIPDGLTPAIYDLLVSMAISQPLYTSVYATIAKELGLESWRLLRVLEDNSSYGGLRLLSELANSGVVEDSVILRRLEDYSIEHDVDRLCRLLAFLGHEFEIRHPRVVRDCIQGLEQALSSGRVRVPRLKFLILDVLALYERHWSDPPRMFRVCV